LNSERKLKNIKLFQEAFYEEKVDQFKFNISGDLTENWVCENGFLKLSGISTRDNKSEAPDIWKVVC